eukprot:5022479-Prymnesium_polylepis.1
MTPSVDITRRLTLLRAPRRGSSAKTVEVKVLAVDGTPAGDGHALDQQARRRITQRRTQLKRHPRRAQSDRRRAIQAAQRVGVTILSQEPRTAVNECPLQSVLSERGAPGRLLARERQQAWEGGGGGGMGGEGRQDVIGHELDAAQLLYLEPGEQAARVAPFVHASHKGGVGETQRRTLQELKTRQLLA